MQKMNLMRMVGVLAFVLIFGISTMSSTVTARDSAVMNNDLPSISIFVDGDDKYILESAIALRESLSGLFSVVVIEVSNLVDLKNTQSSHDFYFFHGTAKGVQIGDETISWSLMAFMLKDNINSKNQIYFGACYSKILTSYLGNDVKGFSGKVDLLVAELFVLDWFSIDISSRFPLLAQALRTGLRSFVQTNANDVAIRVISPVYALADALPGGGYVPVYIYKHYVDKEVTTLSQSFSPIVKNLHTFRSYYTYSELLNLKGDYPGFVDELLNEYLTGINDDATIKNTGFRDSIEYELSFSKATYEVFFNHRAKVYTGEIVYYKTVYTYYPSYTEKHLYYYKYFYYQTVYLTALVEYLEIDGSISFNPDELDLNLKAAKDFVNAGEFSFMGAASLYVDSSLTVYFDWRLTPACDVPVEIAPTYPQWRGALNGYIQCGWKISTQLSIFDHGLETVGTLAYYGKANYATTVDSNNIPHLSLNIEVKMYLKIGLTVSGITLSGLISAYTKLNVNVFNPTGVAQTLTITARCSVLFLNTFEFRIVDCSGTASIKL